MEKERIIPQIQVRTQVRSGQGGGYVNGVYYADKSGVCGSTTVPPYYPPYPPQPYPPQPYPPQPTGGGYVGGVWYSDKSGVC